MNMNSCSCAVQNVNSTDELGNLLRLVGDEKRLQMLTILRGEGTHCVCEFENHIEGASQSLLSHHLADLREAGLVQASKQGLRVYYELTEHGRRVMGVLDQLKCIERSHDER